MPTKSAVTRMVLPALLVVGLFFAGLLVGRHGDTAWAAVKHATIESYQTRYRVMSASGIDSIVYYVSTKDSTNLYAMAETSSNILDVADTKIKDLYDVRVSYASRVETVKSLRSLDNIDAVITIPLICH